MRGRGRGGSKPSVQPEDGTTLGVGRLKRVADFGPPTVGTLPVRNKKAKRGRGRGGFSAAGDSRGALPPRVGCVGRGESRGARGGRGRGLARGASSGGGPSRSASPWNDKGKEREVDEGRDHQQQHDGDRRPNGGRDGARTPPSAIPASLPPRPPSATHFRFESPNSRSGVSYSPSQPVSLLSFDSDDSLVPVPVPTGALQLRGVPDQSTSGTAEDLPQPSSSRLPAMPTHRPDNGPPAQPVVDPPRLLKFKPRNHNVRENDPPPPPAPPAVESSPVAPAPPKFKPRNHNPRKNDPKAIPQPLVPPPPTPTTTTTTPQPALASHPHEQPSSHQPASPPSRATKAPSSPDPPLPAPALRPTSEAPEDVELSEQALQAPSATPSAPVEGVMWLKPEATPPNCWYIGPGVTKKDRNRFRNEYVLGLRKQLGEEGKKVTATKWRQDGLGLDWHLKDKNPRPQEDSDDDSVQILPTPPRKTLETVFLDDSPSPPLAHARLARIIPASAQAQAPAPARSVTPVATLAATPPAAPTVIPVDTPAPSQAPEPDFTIAGALTIPFPPYSKYEMSQYRQSDGFKEWLDKQLEPFQTPAIAIVYFTTLTGLRVRWKPVQGAASRKTVSPPRPSAPVASALPVDQADCLPVAEAPSRAYVEQAQSTPLAQTTSISTAELPQEPASIQEPPPGLVPPPESPASGLSFAQAKYPSGLLTFNPPATSTPSLSTTGASALDLSTLTFPTGSCAGLSAAPLAGPSSHAAPDLWNPSAIAGPSPSVSHPALFPVPASQESAALASPFLDTVAPVPERRMSPSDTSPAETGEATPAGSEQPAYTLAERIGNIETQLTAHFDRIDRWMRLQESFPARAEQLQRQIERTEASIFDLQNQLEIEKAKLAEESHK